MTRFGFDEPNIPAGNIVGGDKRRFQLLYHDRVQFTVYADTDEEGIALCRVRVEELRNEAPLTYLDKRQTAWEVRIYD